MSLILRITLILLLLTTYTYLYLNEPRDWSSEHPLTWDETLHVFVDLFSPVRGGSLPTPTSTRTRRVFLFIQLLGLYAAGNWVRNLFQWNFHGESSTSPTSRTPTYPM
jgi:hypothetical protein